MVSFIIILIVHICDNKNVFVFILVTILNRELSADIKFIGW